MRIGGTPACDFRTGCLRVLPVPSSAWSVRGAIKCCRASSDPPTTFANAPLGCDSSPENCDPAVIRRLLAAMGIARF